MTTIREIERVLEVYSLSDILEENDLTDADALLFLLEEELIELPDVQPV